MPHDICISDLCTIGADFEKNLQQFIAAGFENVELMMDGPVWSGFASKRHDLISMMKRYPINYTLHGPGFETNLASDNETIRHACLETYLDAISFAACAGCPTLLVHPGFCQIPGADKNRVIQRSKELLAALCKCAKESGVRLVVENVGFNGTSIYTYNEFIHLLDGFGDEAGYVIDIGHALLNGWDCASLIRDTSKRLYGIHLHDNNSISDQHLPIGQGNALWDDIFREISALSHSVNLILEYDYGTPLSEFSESRKILIKSIK